MYKHLSCAGFKIKLTSGSGNAGTCEKLHDRSRIRLRQKAGVCASAQSVIIAYLWCGFGFVDVDLHEIAYTVYHKCFWLVYVPPSSMFVTFLRDFPRPSEINDIRSATAVYVNTVGPSARFLTCFELLQLFSITYPVGVVTGIFHWHKIFPITLWPWGRLSL